MIGSLQIERVRKRRPKAGRRGLGSMHHHLEIKAFSGARKGLKSQIKQVSTLGKKTDPQEGQESTLRLLQWHSNDVLLLFCSAFIIYYQGGLCPAMREEVGEREIAPTFRMGELMTTRRPDNDHRNSAHLDPTFLICLRARCSPTFPPYKIRHRAPSSRTFFPLGASSSFPIWSSFG